MTPVMLLFGLALPVPPAQSPQDAPSFAPQVAVQQEDYAVARRHFATRLLHPGPASAKPTVELKPPPGVSEVDFPSGSLRLHAWVNVPDDEGERAYPTVVFLHGGFAFSREDWDMAQPYRDAGFIVLAPILRGENGQPGVFSLFYDEVEDVLAAGEYLRRQPYVDEEHLFVAGHSVGGTLSLLAAMASNLFRASASFSGSPDQVIYCNRGIAKERVPFDMTDARELEMRSPLAFAASFKCPARLYCGTQEVHFHATSDRTAELARAHELDVEAIRVEGNHSSAVPAAMKQSIEFFRRH